MELGTISFSLITEVETSIWIATKSHNYVIGTVGSAPTASCCSKNQQMAQIFGCVTSTPTEEKRRCAATARAASRGLQINSAHGRQGFRLKHRPVSFRRN